MKKFIAIGAVALLLVCMVILNGRLTDNEAKTAAEPKSTFEPEPADSVSAPVDYFEMYRGERESVRAMEMEYLDEIIAASPQDAEASEEAAAQKLSLISDMEKEFTIESLVKAKGFEDAAVSFHQGSVNVVVKADILTDAEVAQVLDIVVTETGLGAANVKIIANGG